MVYVKYVYYLIKIRDWNLNDALEKANDFLESYEDPTKSVTHDKNSDEKYKLNIHIIKIIIGAILLCAEQGIVLRGHREQDSSNDTGKISDTE